MNSYPLNDEPSLESGSPKRGGEPWGRPPNWFGRNLKLVLIGSVIAIAVLVTVAVCESVDQRRRQAEISSRASETVPLATPTPTSAPAYSFPVTRRDFNLDLEEASRFRRLLEGTPDTPETRKQVWINDVGAMWDFLEKYGNGRPGPEEGSEAVIKSLEAALRNESALGRQMSVGWSAAPVLESTPWISGWGLDYFTAFKFYEQSGIDGRLADLTLRTGAGQTWQGFAAGPETLEVVLGDYDPAEILGKIARCAECVPYETRDRAGVQYLAWGDDFAGGLSRRLKPPWLDYVGRGGHVAIFDGQIVRSLSTDGIESLIDARLGRVPSLADDEAYVTAANALDALGAYTGAVSAADFSFDGLQVRLSERTISRNSYGSAGASLTVTVNATPRPDAPSRGDAVVSSAPFLKPFQVAAFGSLPITDQQTVDQVIVLVHADEESAAANVDLLLGRLDKTMLSDGDPLYAPRIKKVEIGAEGRVLAAKITAYFKPNDHLSPVFLVDLPVTVSK